ncbi:acetate--CoA ligase family protein [Nonomuraea sediminis]|uniref:acetate--CoA ligase family protein n=1 Tax=Nonomuraea sediminis TaxID=2835864 RepID=UPI001BDCF5E8|nr:acetate--CoA ligase family protein [Nonomuraea sediminis]
MSELFDPASVAVVGASANPAKWGYWLARGALRGSHRRKVHLVNRSGAVVDGVPSVPSLDLLPEAPELAVLCVPAPALDGVVSQALDLGVRAFVAITAGLEREREQELAARVRAAGARLVGPNSLGVYDSTTALELAWGTFTPGSLGIVSQSGQLGLELAGLAAQAGMGVSRFVSVGDQVDVTAAEVLAGLAGHDATAAVLLYLESFHDGRALVETLVRLREAGKPAVVLTVGASRAGREAARSHTGALTAGTEVVEAACRAAGAVLVQTPAQAVDVAQFLVHAPAHRVETVAVVGDSGGQGALAADVLTRHGLHLPAAPIDLAGAGERDMAAYAQVIEPLLASGEVDAVVLTGYFASYGADTPSLAAAELEVVAALGDLVRRHGRPVVVHSMTRDSAAVRALRERGIPVYATIDQVGWALARRSPAAPARAATPGAPSPGRGWGYLEARALLSGYGVPYGRAVGVKSDGEVAAAVRGMRGPYVVKAGWLEHKTEVGGVAVGATDPAAAVREMRERLGEGEYVVEELDGRDGVVELVVGGRRDPSFGPVVAVGIGGTASEVYADVTVELAPVDPGTAEAMLRRLRGFPLLDGWRGARGADLRAAAEAVAAVSRLVAERDDVAECEVNPLRVGPDGALAVDALVVARQEGR